MSTPREIDSYVFVQRIEDNLRDSNCGKQSIPVATKVFLLSIKEIVFEY